MLEAVPTGGLGPFVVPLPRHDGWQARARYRGSPRANCSSMIKKISNRLKESARVPRKSQIHVVSRGEMTPDRLAEFERSIDTLLGELVRALDQPNENQSVDREGGNANG